MGLAFYQNVGHVVTAQNLVFRSILLFILISAEI